MKLLYKILLFTLPVLLAACVDDLELSSPIEMPGDDGPKVEAYLALNVADFTVSSVGTRAAEPEIATDEENRIADIWVFQYDSDGNQLIKPSYYPLSKDQNPNNIKVLLRDDVASTICVVANTSNPNWALGKTEFSTYTGLKSAVLPMQDPIKEDELTQEINPKSIPMEGEISGVTVSSSDVITVPVTRMFAKIKIAFGELFDKIYPRSIDIANIPRYCRVVSLTKDITNGTTVDDSSPAAYPNDATSWTLRSFNTSDYKKGDEYVIYIPENLQGKIDVAEGEDLIGKIPAKALEINLQMKYTDEFSSATTLEYTLYPGEDETKVTSAIGHSNNLNIRRNNVYRATLNIHSVSEDMLHTPSSNCFVVSPGETLSFEPYYRVEKGGDYNFTDYLDPNDTSGSKIIDNVKIIWQTDGAIGNNEKDACVWFQRADNLLHSKIYVKTHFEGNALIGAYNSNGDVLWSWHIWITDNEPDNLGNAVVYSTYRWEGSLEGKGGIKYNEERIPGYSVMPCNLGALAYSPDETYDPAINSDSWYCTNWRTYGTLYQWGRKDPFPPAKTTNQVPGRYDYDQTSAHIELYDNAHSKIDLTTDGYVSTKDELFNTILSTDVGSSKDTGLRYSVNHPTMFMAGAKALNNGYNNASSYINRGDWLPEGDERLWGAIPKEGKEYYTPYQNRAIWDNYGPEKTIFDPCPKGWRVPPGDLWLGFTKNGLNYNSPSNQDFLINNMNVLPTTQFNETHDKRGYWYCLNGWQNPDPKTYSFFPTQGSRFPSGQCWLGGICGNYHNATSDATIKVNGVTIDRVNILHMHAQPGAEHKIYIFEDNLCYYNKAVAGPVRCVRDRK